MPGERLQFPSDWQTPNFDSRISTPRRQQFAVRRKSQRFNRVAMAVYFNFFLIFDIAVWITVFWNTVVWINLSLE